MVTNARNKLITMPKPKDFRVLDLDIYFLNK